MIRQVFKIGHQLFFLVVLINLVILNIWVFSKPSKNAGVVARSGHIDTSEEKIDTPRTVLKNNESCGKDCVSDIYKTIYQATTSGQGANKFPGSDQSSSGQVVIKESVTNTFAAKEYFVPLGSGSSTAEDWTDVPGIEAYIDLSQYGQIDKVKFEVSIRIPTGNQVAYARLYNTSDLHPVWFSEVSLEGGTPKLLISSPITLDSGNKLYRVQMKTSLKFTANIDNARIRILTK